MNERQKLLLYNEIVLYEYVIDEDFVDDDYIEIMCKEVLRTYMEMDLLEKKEQELEQESKA
jgi:hypothetical protein